MRKRTRLPETDCIRDEGHQEPTPHPHRRLADPNANAGLSQPTRCLSGSPVPEGEKHGPESYNTGVGRYTDRSPAGSLGDYPV